MLKKERIPIIGLAMFCLLSGLWAGLSRIGWDITILPITAHHGAIMVGGFIGTLIALEKIIPLKRRELYIIPILNALSVVFFFYSLPEAGDFHINYIERLTINCFSVLLQIAA